VGSAADPWRVAQARHRNRADECGQVYGQATRPAVPRMEDIPPQSCRRHRRDGSVRRADNLVSSALWTADHGARPTTDRMAPFRASISVADSTAIRAADVASDDQAAPTHPATCETSMADSTES